jgi:ABC-type polysaccharide/polyol phosphate transport system ATPase subunit
MDRIVIEVSGLSKIYRIYERPIDRLKEALMRGRKSFHQDFQALHDLSFSVPHGQTLGVIGPNGSGKSTTLQLIAGTLQPTAGRIEVNGRLSALLDLGAGFNPQFTGRENVHMTAVLMGLSRADLGRQFPEIERFAEIGAFIDQPVKTYSSGMFVRLAFSVAIHVNPDVLLVDEALAVGDAVFQHRCIDRIEQLRRKGVSILFVSHDITAVRSLCDRVILLDRGQLIEIGDPELVVSRYISLITERERQYASRAARSGLREAVPQHGLGIVKGIPHIDRRHGSGRAQFLGVTLCDVLGREASLFEAGEPFRIRMSVEAHQRLETPLVGINLGDRLGNEITATNNELEGFCLPALEPGDVLTVEFTLHPPALLPGTYSLSVACNDGYQEAHELCDWIVNSLIFEVTSRRQIIGICRMPTQIGFVVQRAANLMLEEAHHASRTS